MKNQLQRLIQLEIPIVQAPMAGIQDSELAIAVSRVGGLGSLPCAMLTPDTIREELQRIESSTDKPYNINFFSHQLLAIDHNKEAKWREVLAPFYREFDIDPAKITAGVSRSPFNHEFADALEGFKPRVVSFHFGLPSEELLERVKAIGAKVLSSATTLKEAQWLEANGADIIVAQGVEAGGHRGTFLNDSSVNTTGKVSDYGVSTQVTTFALLPQIANSVNVPVIAAGGIADAQGVAAAMALGASGVQLGTAYMLCDEAKTSDIHRNILKSDQVQETLLTNLFSGRPARGIVNRLIKELGPMSELVPAFPTAATATTPLRSKAEAQGTGDFSPLWCGQNASGCQEISAAELTLQLAAGLKR